VADLRPATSIVAVAPCGCFRIALVKDAKTEQRDINELYRKAATRGYEVREVGIEAVQDGRFGCDACRRASAPVQMVFGREVARG
jgi:hypothetical protein